MKEANESPVTAVKVKVGNLQFNQRYVEDTKWREVWSDEGYICYI